jgi:hypothetical protein
MGHPGIKKTMELLQRNYCWLSLWQDITEYVRMCIPCQQMKVFPSQMSGLLNLLPLLKEPVSNQPSLVKMVTHLNKVSEDNEGEGTLTAFVNRGFNSEASNPITVLLIYMQND